MWHNGGMSTLHRDPSAGINAALAAELRAERAAQQMTVDALAERSGVPKRTLIRLLNAERAIAVEPLCDIAGAFGVSVTTLVGRAERRLSEQERAETASVTPIGVTSGGYGRSVASDADILRRAAALDYGTADDIDREAEDQATLP